jgi:hypothetical protein
LSDKADVKSDLVGKEMQVAPMHKSSDGAAKRGAFEMKRVSIIDDSENPFYKRLLIVDSEGHDKAFRLRNTSASRETISSSHPADVQPSFAKHSVVIAFPESEIRLIVANPTMEDQRSFLDRLCLAGCIVPDLMYHFKLLPQAAQTMDGIRLGRTTSSRTTTNADIVALKVATDDDKMSQLTEEMQILLNLQHSSIVTAYGLYAVKVQGERSLGMLLDYKSGGDLDSYIPTDGLPEWMVKGIMAPICEALEYLHGLPVVHRDVKPSNVLCDRAADGSLKVVLADFGLAAHIADGKRLSQRCGTGGYIAPELFQQDWPKKWRTETAADLAKTDMFSFGMLVYATAFGHNPFGENAKNKTYLYRRNARGLLPLANMAGRSDELQSLLSGLCAKDPRQRLSSSETLLHPWFDSDRGGSSADDGHKATTVEWAAFEAAAQ